MRITDEDRKAFWTLYKEGATDEAIAEAVGCSANTVYNWRHSCGLPGNGRRRKRAQSVVEPVKIIRPDGTTEEPADKAKALYKIAYELGVAFGKGLQEALNLSKGESDEV